MTDLVLVLMIAGPALVTFFLKSDAALSFLVLCLGFVLSVSVIGDLKQLLSEQNLSVTKSTLGLVIILVPLVITMLVTRKAAGKGFKFVLHLLTALCAGGLLALSLGPILNNSSVIDLFNSQIWKNLDKVQSIIIGAGATLSLLLIWTKAVKKSSNKKH
jgi:hypothetical protein